MLRSLDKLSIDFGKLTDEKGENIVPAIIVDDIRLARDGLTAILMVGFMNQSALDQTINTGKVTFYSRTTGQLWTKGEESGNTLWVRQIFTDCDMDTLLIAADPVGPTCHTGATSCFEIAPGESQLNSSQGLEVQI